jgi:hypothetical protein
VIQLSVKMEAAVVEQGRDRVGHVKRVRYVKKGIAKRKCCRRVQRPVLQELFLLCLDVFKGPGTIPPTQDVLKLHRILGTFHLTSNSDK